MMLTQKKYNLYSAVVFTIVTVVHLWRALTGTDLVIGTTEVAVWISWLAVLVAGCLAWHGWKMSK